MSARKKPDRNRPKHRGIQQNKYREGGQQSLFQMDSSTLHLSDIIYYLEGVSNGCLSVIAARQFLPPFTHGKKPAPLVAYTKNSVCLLGKAPHWSLTIYIIVSEVNITIFQY